MAHNMPDKSLPLHYFMLQKAEQFYAAGQILSYDELRSESLPIWNHITKAQRDSFKLQALVKKEEIVEAMHNMHLHDQKIAEKQRNENIAKRERVKEHLDKKLKGSKDWKKEIFILADVNIFLTTKNDIYPAELALSKFSLHDGFIDSIHFHIDLDAGREFPSGLLCDGKSRSEETHQIPLDMPRDQTPGKFIRITQKGAKEKLKKFLGSDSVMFTVKERNVKYDVEETVQRSFKKLFDITVSAARLEQLIKAMKVHLGAMKYQDMDPHDIEMLVWNDPQAFLTTGCKFHFDIDAPMFCSLARVHRWAYFMCKLMLDPKYLKQGKHTPRDEIENVKKDVQWIFGIDQNENLEEPPETHNEWILQVLNEMREEEDRAYCEQYKDEIIGNEVVVDIGPPPFSTPPRLNKFASSSEAKSSTPKVEPLKIPTPIKPKKTMNTEELPLTPKVDAPPKKNKVETPKQIQVAPPERAQSPEKIENSTAASTIEFCILNLEDFLDDTYGQQTTLTLEDTTVLEDEMFVTARDNFSESRLEGYEEFEKEISAENCDVIETSTTKGYNSDDTQDVNDYLGAGSFQPAPQAATFTTCTLDELLGL